MNTATPGGGLAALLEKFKGLDDRVKGIVVIGGGFVALGAWSFLSGPSGNLEEQTQVVQQATDPAYDEWRAAEDAIVRAETSMKTVCGDPLLQESESAIRSMIAVRGERWKAQAKVALDQGKVETRSEYLTALYVTKAAELQGLAPQGILGSDPIANDEYAKALLDVLEIGYALSTLGDPRTGQPLEVVRVTALNAALDDCGSSAAQYVAEQSIR